MWGVAEPGNLKLLPKRSSGSRAHALARALLSAERTCKVRARVPSLRSGFRLRAPASLTPAKRLNFRPNKPRLLLGKCSRCLGLRRGWLRVRGAHRLRIGPDLGANHLAGNDQLDAAVELPPRRTVVGSHRIRLSQPARDHRVDTHAFVHQVIAHRAGSLFR